MDIKEQIDSFLDKAKERLTTPFIITYGLVWLIHHWRLAYIVISFDITESRGSRKQQIEDYITSNNGWIGMAIIPVLWAIGSILIYYAVTLLSEVILFYFQRIQTEVRLRINNGRKFVTIEEFNTYYNRTLNLETKNVEVEKKYSDLNEKFEKTVNSNTIENGKLHAQISELSAKNIAIEASHMVDIEEIKRENNSQVKELKDKIEDYKGIMITIPKVSNNISEVFKNTTWLYERLRNDGGIESRERVLQNGDILYSETYKVEYPIQDFKYNPTTNTIEFKRAGFETKLFMVEEGLLVGAEGKDVTKYTRIA